MSIEHEDKTRDFLRTAVQSDLESGRFANVVTRFPPEPNGYLHIGHAKAVCLDFGIAAEFGGTCNLRFDDTNPLKEDQEFVDAIEYDIRWLGFDWGERIFHASDYFEQLFEYAVTLIKNGDAYVDDLSPEEIREHRGTLTEPGVDSPYRERTVEENLELFNAMRRGDFEEGKRVLRAKIDMSSPNINMRDPVMYRIRLAEHHRTGGTWCIYPTYDFTHGQSDSIEGVTHSLCDLGYEDHRPLYDWFCRKLSIHHPRQIEFARLNITYTVLSKRNLRLLVEGGYVDGWDDPRMPTLAGLRRRGYTPSSIRTFIDRVGVAKVKSTVDLAFLEHCLREELNKTAPRVMAVLRPLKVIIDNYPEDQVEEFDADNNPEDPGAGTRKLPFSKEIYIEQEDFMEDPPKKYFRLSPGKEIRLKHAYYITCTDVVKDAETGTIQEIHCTYDPESKGGGTPDGRRVKGTSHWVSARHAVKAEIRLYDTLFTVGKPDEIPQEHTLTDYINPESLEVLDSCMVEPSLSDAAPGTVFQFLRTGYFAADPETSADGYPVFNRSVGLRDSWSKIQAKSGK